MEIVAKEETEFLVIAALINVVITICIKAKTEYTQKNCKCRVCSDVGESDIIIECSKLDKKEYKTRYDCTVKAIH